MPYPEEMVAPMRAEVTSLGAEEVRTGEAAKAALADASGTSLFFINSVCGCAAGSARPGLAMSLDGSVRPDRMYTAFAGNDTEAVNEIRSTLIGYPPSSPCIAMFKDGDLVAVVERMDIQAETAEQLAVRLKNLYAEHCSTTAA